MPIIGLESEDDLSYTFKRDDGSTLRAPRTAASTELANELNIGQAAVQPSAQLEQAAQRPAADMRVAGPGGGQPDPTIPTFDVSELPKEGDRPGMAQAQQQYKVRNLQGIAAQEGLGRQVVQVPGSRAITAEERRAAEEQKTLVSRSGTRRTEGALPPEDVGRLREGYARQIATEMDIAAGRAELDKEKLEQERKLVEATTRNIDLGQHETQYKLDDLERRRNVARDEIKQVDQWAAAWKEDPNRLFKEKGTWSVIAAAIAQSLGAYAAIVGRAPNFAMDLVQGAINRDVAAQRSDFQAKKDFRGNLVGELNNIVGDIDVATELAKKYQMDAAANYAAQVGLSSRKGENDLAYQQLVAGIQQKALQAEEALIRLRAGNVTESVAGPTLGPQAASGGGVRLQTDKELAGTLRGQAEVGKQYREVHGLPDMGKVREAAEIAYAKAAGKAKASKEFPAALDPNTRAKYYDDRSKIDLYATDVKFLIDKLKGLGWAEETKDGKLRLKEGGKDIPGLGGVDTPIYDQGRLTWIYQTEEGRSIYSAMERLHQAYTLSMTGQAATDAQTEKFKLAAAGWTEKQAAEGIKYMHDVVQNKIRSLDAAYGPEVKKAYEQGLQDVTRMDVERGVESQKDRGVVTTPKVEVDEPKDVSSQIQGTL